MFSIIKPLIEKLLRNKEVTNLIQQYCINLTSSFCLVFSAPLCEIEELTMYEENYLLIKAEIISENYKTCLYIQGDP